MTRYYRLVDEKSVPGRWYLRGPRLRTGEAVDPRRFTIARPIEVAGPLVIPLRHAGQSLDFTLADFDMPVASRALAERLEDVAGGALQVIPARVEGQPGAFAVLNVVRAVQCLDESATTIQWWTSADEYPERAGTYRMVIDPVIDARRAGGEPLFRLSGWEIALICDQTVCDSLAKAGFTGLRFDRLRSSESISAA